MSKYQIELTIKDNNKQFDTSFILHDNYLLSKNGTINNNDILWYLKNTQEGESFISSHLAREYVDSDHIEINSIELIQSGGKHKSKNHKRRTPEKVEINKKVKAVFVGPKGGKYVRKNGKYVPLKKLV
jgi:PBCV-specific basic adaptor domain